MSCAPGSNFLLKPSSSPSDKSSGEKGSLRDGDAPHSIRVRGRRPRALPAADRGLGAGCDRVDRGCALRGPRLRERPRVVYSASLEEVEDEAQGSLKININTANVDELDELPQVGPATAETIVEYRRTNGMFRSVEELASIQKYKNRELTFRALLAEDRTQVLELSRA